MALIPGTLVKADNALDRAVKNALAGPLYRIGEKKEEGYHRSALNSSQIVSGGGGSVVAGYQGYFAIVDASDNEGIKVKVTDPREESSAYVAMPFYVNANRGNYLSEWISDTLSSGTFYVFLHFDAETGTTSIEANSSEFPGDTSTDVYYQLGRVFIGDSGDLKIYQDHLSGIPRILWIGSMCADDDGDIE